MFPCAYTDRKSERSLTELLMLNETGEKCLDCNSLQEREKVTSLYCANG